MLTNQLIKYIYIALSIFMIFLNGQQVHAQTTTRCQRDSSEEATCRTEPDFLPSLQATTEIMRFIAERNAREAAKRVTYELNAAIDEVLASTNYVEADLDTKRSMINHWKVTTWPHINRKFSYDPYLQQLAKQLVIERMDEDLARHERIEQMNKEASKP
jgi:hypothetical protein